MKFIGEMRSIAGIEIRHFEGAIAIEESIEAIEGVLVGARHASPSAARELWARHASPLQLSDEIVKDQYGWAQQEFQTHTIAHYQFAISK